MPSLDRRSITSARKQAYVVLAFASIEAPDNAPCNASLRTSLCRSSFKEWKTNGFSGALIMRTWPSLLMKKLCWSVIGVKTGELEGASPKLLQVCWIRCIRCKRIFFAAEHRAVLDG